jgi:hypothetical protein
MHTTNIYATLAVAWALKQLGSTGYPGLCYAFCENAYELGGEIIRTARAVPPRKPQITTCPGLFPTRRLSRHSAAIFSSIVLEI